MRKPLPPGQRGTLDFPRFGLLQFAERFPTDVSQATLDVTGLVMQELHLSDPLADLPRVEQVSDFHCVTSWTRRELRWCGVRFIDFYKQVIVPHAHPHSDATQVALRGQDGARTALPLADLLAPDVLLADTLEGERLTIEHGAPWRLIAPAHYAYKSVKHLSRLEFRDPLKGYRPSGYRFMDHPRARVAFEERGRILPGWLLRYLYRPLIDLTVARFAKVALPPRSPTPPRDIDDDPVGP